MRRVRNLRPSPCRLGWACEGCGRPSPRLNPRRRVELATYEVDTRYGPLCMTLCGLCAAARRTPRLRAAEAALRALGHASHYTYPWRTVR
ncbi:MAG: hypothetical protein GEU93_09910 [Propionibacteriales bacterium]|nr:hypothetical protein [Propionibacteriales bacterium]